MHNKHYSQGTGHDTGWASVITGAFIGAGITLLIAPQSGRELRAMLCNYAVRAKEDLLDKAEEAYDKGEEVIDDAGQSAREFAKHGQEAMKDAGRSVQNSAKQIQEIARDPARSAL